MPVDPDGGITEEFRLDAAAALAQVDALERAVTLAFERAAESAGSALAAAFSGATFAVEAPDLSGVVGEVEGQLAGAGLAVPVDADVAALADQVEDALAGAAGDVEVHGDTGPLTDEVEQAVAEADPQAVVEGDASAVTDAIDAAVGEADTDVEVDADASGVADAVEGALADADTTVEVGADAAPVTEAIDAAVGAADTDVELEVTADASSIPGNVESALAEVDTEIPVTADASGVGEAIGDAVAGADTSVTLSADSSGIPDAIETAVDQADATVEVDVDASGVTDAIEEAVSAADTSVDIGGDAATDLNNIAGAAQNASAGIGDLSGRAGQFAGVAAAAGGSAAGLVGALPSAGLLAGIGLGVTALAGTVGVFVNEALEADTATRFYNRSLGDMAASVERINVGGLNTDIGSLAVQLGSSDDAIRTVVARLFQLGEGAGRSRTEVGRTAEQLVALAARAVAVNPALGDVGQVTEGLVGALARGGRFAANFGITLTAAEVEARALADTNKTSTDQLTLFDRAAAGAAITVERLGNRLGTDVAEGAQTAALQLRSVRAEFGEFLEEVGGPLLDDVVQLARSLREPATELAAAFGELAQAGLPAAVALVEALTPALAGAASAVEAIGVVLGPLLGLLGAIPAPVYAGAAAMVAGAQGARLLSAALGAVRLAGFASTVASGTAVLGPFGFALAAVGAIVTGYAAAKANAERRTAEFRAAIEADTQAIEENNAALATNVDRLISRRLGTDLIRDLAQVGITLRDVRAAVEGGPEAIDALVGRFNLLTPTTRGAAIEMNILRDRLTAASAEFGNASNDAEAFARFMDDGATASRQNADAVEVLSRRVPSTAAVYAALFDQFRAGTVTTLQLRNAAALLGVEVIKLEEFGEAVREAIASVTGPLVDALPEATGAIGRLGDEIEEVGERGNPAKATRNMEETGRRLRDIAQQAERDVEAFDVAVRDAVDSVADGFAQQIPSAADALDTAIQQVTDRLKEAAEAQRAALPESLRGPRIDIDETVLGLGDITSAIEQQTAEMAEFFDHVQELARQGLDDTVQVLLERGPQAGRALANSLVTAEPAQRAAFERTVEGFRHEAERSANFIGDIAGQLPAGVQAAIVAARAQFQQRFGFAEAVGSEIGEVRAQFVAGIGAMAAEARAEATNVGTAVGEGIGEGVRRSKRAIGLSDVIADLRSQAEAMDRLFRQMGQLNAREAQAVIDTLATEGFDAAVKLSDALVAADAATRRSFNTSIDAFDDQRRKATGIIAELATTMPELADHIVEALEEKFGDLDLSTATDEQKREVLRIIGSMGQGEGLAAAGGAARNLGAKFLTDFAAAMNADRGNVLAAAQGVATSAGQAAGSTLSRTIASGIASTQNILDTTARTAGANTAAAFLQGMMGVLRADTTTNILTAAGGGLVSNVEHGARVAAASDSPSRLFADVGRDLMLGLAQGIGAEEAAVVRAAEGVVAAAAAVPSASPAFAFAGAQTPGTGPVSGVPAGTTINADVTVNNPTGEPAEESVRRELAQLVYLYLS